MHCATSTAKSITSSFSEATFRQYLLKYLQIVWLKGPAVQNEMNS